jgi:hypothetical protein
MQPKKKQSTAAQVALLSRPPRTAKGTQRQGGRRRGALTASDWGGLAAIGGKCSRLHATATDKAGRGAEARGPELRWRSRLQVMATADGNQATAIHRTQRSSRLD